MRSRRVQVRYKSSGLIVNVSEKYAITLLRRGICYLVNNKLDIRGRSTINKC